MIHWKLKSFDQLSSSELYQIIALREQVFVVEQQIIYQDCDGKDLKAYHLMGYKNDESELVAYARILPPKLKFEEAAFGRVVVACNHRAYGLGTKLVKQLMTSIFELYGPVSIRISAQAYLKDFYQKFLFVPIGAEYIEEGLPHLEMLFENPKP